LRVLSPPALAVHQLAKHLPKFRAEYPKVSLELSVPGPVETVDENFDVTLIQVTRPLVEGEFVARLLAHSEVIICASPEYLDRRGRPLHPSDMPQHEVMLPPSVREITLQRGRLDVDEPGGETVSYTPMRSALSTGHIDTTYAAALAGLGVAGLPSFVIEDALLEHALERVLPEWHVLTSSIYAAMPTRKHVPARTRAFIDFLIKVFGGKAEDPWLLAAGCQTRPPG
jgi:DNA-binding transcriptional LysR family regulator